MRRLNVALCVWLTSLAPLVVRGQDSPAIAYDQYRSQVEVWHRQGQQVVRWIEDPVASQARHDDGSPYERKDVVPPATDRLTAVAEALRAIDAVHDGLAARQITLAQFWQRIQAATERAADAITWLAISEATWKVRLLQQRHQQQISAIDAELRAETRRLESTLKGEQQNAAVAALRQETTRREREQIQQVLRDYTTITREFCARRGELCQDMWQLVGFAQGAGRADDARRFESTLRECLGYSGRALGPSQVDHFSNYPGSPDRLILRRVLVEDVPSLHKMNAALNAEPVEMFKVAAANAAMEVRGSPAEQLARTLSARLTQFYDLQQRQEAGYRRLAQLNQAARDTAGTWPDIAALARLLDAYEAAAQDDANRAETVRRAREAVTAAETAMATATRELERARANVMLTPSLKLAPRGDARAKSAAELIEQHRRSIALQEQTLHNENLPADQRRAVEQVVLPRLRDEIAAIEAEATRAVQPQAEARDRAAAALAAAQARLAEVPAPRPGELDRLWTAFRDAWQTAVRAVPVGRREGLPEVPLAATAAAVQEAGRGVNLLRQQGLELTRRRDEAIAAMQQALQELQRDDPALRDLASRVTGIRVSALVMAETMLTSLGAGAQDEVTVAVGRLKEQLQKGQGVFASVDDCTRTLDEALRYDPLEVRKQIVGQLQERMGIAGQTMQYIGTGAEAVEAMRTLANDLQNERTALRAVAKILDLSANAGEKVPVAGAVLAPMMKIYGMTAEAAGTAAVAIQEHLIEQNIQHLFDRPRPEQHLYTLQEVVASASLQNDEARQRILTMLQARRLIALAGADAARARDAGR